MRAFASIALCLPLALAGCGRGPANNAAIAANLIEQEGLGDLNAVVSGDELEPMPEAADDMAGKRAAQSGPGK